MRLLVSFVLLLLVCPAALFAQQPAYALDPRFQKERAAAMDARSRPLDDRMDHWKRANKIAGGGCMECLYGVLQLAYQEGGTKAAINGANLLEQVATKPSDKAFAATMRGNAIFRANSQKAKPEQMELAEASFRAAIAADPSLTTALYMDGRTLALLGRDAEARSRFEEFVTRVPATNRYRVRARHFAENPALARARMAPPFTVRTADGTQFTLDEMGGRVVLVDFWATWCGPCKEELPHIKKIAQEFAGQPFVLISVSWDKDAEAWQSFVAKNGMSWNQYRDADHELSTAYGVESIPHYFTIDADGVLQAEKVGSGSDIEGRLKKLVAKARAGLPAPVGAKGVTELPAGS